MAQEKEQSTTSDIFTQIAIYTASIGIGLVSMWTSIRNNFNTNMKSATDWFKEIRQKRANDIKAIDHLSGAPHLEAHLKIHDEYAKSFRRILEEKGYHNSFQKFKFLKQHQRVQVVGIAITIATIAAGAIINIRQSKQNDKLIRQLEKMERDKDANTSQGMG